jgi:WD40 repeat protein
VPRSRPLLRGIATRVTIAACLAAGFFAFKDQVPKLLSVPASRITTGAISSPIPTPSAASERTITQSAEFRAHDGAIDGLSLSGDGRLIVTTGADRKLRTFDAETQQPRLTIALDDGEATSLAVRNNRAVTSHADGVAAVYDLDTGRRLYRFKRNDASIWAAVFAGSEDRIAAAGHDWTVALWEPASEEIPRALLEGHENAVQALAADPNGRWLASGGADRMVKLWNLETQEARRTYRNNPDFITTLSFSPDSTQLAAGNLDGSIKMWSTLSGRSLRTYANHKARVTSIAFSPDGEILASAAEDGSVRIRGVKRKRLYSSLGDLGRGAKVIAFTNDGRSLLTGGEDGVVRLWSLPEAEVAARN